MAIERLWRLIGAGADCSIRNSIGQTALDVAKDMDGAIVDLVKNAYQQMLPNQEGAEAELCTALAESDNVKENDTDQFPFPYTHSLAVSLHEEPQAPSASL
eukprot:m.198108 g.198108  ORF g.198108 m.198108 type:complete len:101 (+) comp39556_c0_seq20:624-926(+)